MKLDIEISMYHETTNHKPAGGNPQASETLLRGLRNPNVRGHPATCGGFSRQSGEETETEITCKAATYDWGITDRRHTGAVPGWLRAGGDNRREVAKMRIQLTPSYLLTDEHSSSNYGRPVLMHCATGDRFGPRDIIQPYNDWPWQPAVEVVQRMVKHEGLTEEEREFIQRFSKDEA
jgi:hypothetical protein